MKRLQEGALAFGVTLAAEQIAQFQAYYELLCDWNTRFNLTAVSDYGGVLTRHFLDSLSCLAALPRGLTDQRVIDVGSGAGFPGLPLKIACPGLRLTLLEATGKKVDFLNAVVTGLRLADVAVVNARAEEAGHAPQHREVYDLAVARAVAVMRVLVELCLPFVRPGGLLIAQKGEDPRVEVQAAGPALRTLGGQLRQTLPVVVPGLEATRHLVVVDKVTSTPARYPRRPGVPTRRPL
jgi:16S rRNA (guanine527-N7)-methyltransferase